MSNVGVLQVCLQRNIGEGERHRSGLVNIVRMSHLADMRKERDLGVMGIWGSLFDAAAHIRAIMCPCDCFDNYITN